MAAPRWPNVALIPHFYDIKWARDLNRLLASLFWCPFVFTERSYLPGRSQLHSYLAHVLPKLRNGDFEAAFFVNLLDDFTPDVIKAGGLSRVYGIVHGSHVGVDQLGKDPRLAAWERAVGTMADAAFTATRFFQGVVPFPSHVVGLPVTEPMAEPRPDGTRILFNHRLQKDKGAMGLTRLPGRIRKRVVVTAPKATLQYVPKVKAAVGEYHGCLNDAAYRRLLRECTFGLSMATHDNFGYAVMEGLFAGLCYLVPDNATTCYRETVPDGLRYGSMEELVERIDYLTDHPDERMELVRQAQGHVAGYGWDRWADTFADTFKRFEPLGRLPGKSAPS